MLNGMMMDRPLLIHDMIAFAARYHGDVAVVSRDLDGSIFRYAYADAHARMARLANALEARAIAPGDRIGTLAWNTHRHYEIYFAAPSMGAICHTINPRLFPEQIVYIVNHAKDRILFFDATFLPLVEAIADRLTSVESFVVMGPDAQSAAARASKLRDLVSYEAMIAEHPPAYSWPEFDERTASSLCYTSGTTGMPKGALYSHRSTLLHTLFICGAENSAYCSNDVVLPIVPMFHANAWGIPYATAMVGAKLVLPGAQYDGASVYELLSVEKVNKTAGVPTVWTALLEHMKKNDLKLPHLQKVGVGGSAMTPALMRGIQTIIGAEATQGWGMTELSPVGSNARLPGRLEGKSQEIQDDYKRYQGRATWGIDWKIVDDAGRRLPHDGVAFGELRVRGPWTASGYFNNPEASAAALDDEGWFRTGDVASITPQGWLKLVDRTKDVVKSGGEWISSIDLENAATLHPDIAQAAVIAAKHPKWDERPLLIVTAAPGAAPDREAVNEFLGRSFAKWQLPDDMIVLDKMPLTATGKISKLELRQRFSDHLLTQKP